MRINNNISALNAWRNLTQTDGVMSRSLERLSSGLRINKAADDAAGLAISEKMRGQTRGLNQAVRNSQDAISLIQTAEGGLSETHSILQRMRELAVQAASDTSTNADRQQIQKEVDALAQEITRISNTSEFNTKNLLAGGFTGQRFFVGANAGQDIAVSIGAMDASSLAVADAKRIATVSPGTTALASDSVSNLGPGFSGSSYDLVVVKTASSYGAVSQTDALGGTGTTGAAGTYTGNRNATFMVKITGTNDVGAGVMEVTAAEYSTDGGTTWSAASVDATGAGTSVATLKDGATLSIADDADNSAADTYTFSATADSWSYQLKDGVTNIGNAVTAYRDTATVTVGDAALLKTLDVAHTTSVVSGTATIGITYMTSSAAVTGANGTIVTDAVTQAGIAVNSQAAASSAIATLDTAITKVSDQRSALGAVQNRLEYTIRNLSTAAENLSAAESRIRDVDMAMEMAAFTRNQILLQAGTAMMAQANQKPQSVLQLLR